MYIYSLFIITPMKFSLLLALLLLMVLFACKNRKNAGMSKTTHKDSTTVAVAKGAFDGIEFARKMDVACGMPLTAGIHDTAHYKGKIYGFCCKECKNDFL